MQLLCTIIAVIQGAHFYQSKPSDEEHILASVTTPTTPASPGNVMGEC